MECGVEKVVLLQIGKRYRIIYDDKGNRAVEKTGILILLDGNLFKLDSKDEFLNTHYILRAVELK